MSQNFQDSKFGSVFFLNSKNLSQFSLDMWFECCLNCAIFNVQHFIWAGLYLFFSRSLWLQIHLHRILSLDIFKVAIRLKSVHNSWNFPIQWLPASENPKLITKALESITKNKHKKLFLSESHECFVTREFWDCDGNIPKAFMDFVDYFRLSCLHPGVVMWIIGKDCPKIKAKFIFSFRFLTKIFKTKYFVLILDFSRQTNCVGSGNFYKNLPFVSIKIHKSKIWL